MASGEHAVYVLDDGTRPPPKRYCGGRLSRTQTIIVSVFSTAILLLTIGILVLYFVTIPALIQSSFASLGSGKGESEHPLHLSKLQVGEFHSTGLVVSLATTLPPLKPLPVWFTVHEPTYYIGTPSNNKLLSLTIPTMIFKLSEPYNIDTTAKIECLDTEGLNGMVTKVLDKNGVDKEDIVVSSDWTVELFGTVWYRGLRVEKVISMKPVALEIEESATVEASTTVSVQDLARATAEKQAIPAIIAVDHPNEKIRQLVPQKDLIVMGSNLPDIHWTDFTMSMTDSGMGVKFDFELENPTTADLDIPSLSFGLGSDGTTLCRVSLSPIRLTPDINHMQFGISVAFEEVGDGEDALAKALGRVLGGQGVTVEGPFVLDGADFVGAATRGLTVELPPLSGKSSSGGLSLPSQSSLLDHLKTQISLSDSTLHVPIELTLPHILPLPPLITFPVSTSISVIGTTVEALTITLDPVVVTSNEDGMTLNTGLHLNAVNTDEAAASLAGSVNPILSVANPAESKLTVGKVMFKTTDGQVLGWSQRLLHDQSVTVPLSPICLSCALSSKQKSATPKKDLGVSVSDIKLAQLTTDSGFSLSTRLSHSTLPLPLSLALGYIGLKVDVSRKPFISIDLPNGINVHSEPGTVDLSTRLIVSHEETVSQRIQSLISTLTTTTTESDSTVGVTGFVIGQSEGLEVVTFSKIVAEVSAGALRGAVAMPTGGSSSSAGKTLAKLNGAEIEVKSASQVKLGAKATVLDVPGGASISLGSLSLDALLDSDKLVSVNLSPLSLSPQAKDIDLSVLLGLASGNPILSQKIAALVNSGFKSDSTHVTITGLVLNPPGVTSGPAVLDQFKNVKITLPLSGSTAPNSVAVKGPPLVDTSALIPANPLSSLAMSPSQINIDTLPRSILSLAAQLDYDNSLPLSVTIPFIQTSVSVNDVELVQPTLRGIALHNGKHSMRPNLALYFQQTDATVQDHVANLVSRLQSGTPPDSKVSVNGVLFGGNGENDRNDLFGFVTLDVSKMLDGLKLPSQSLTLPSSSSDGSGLAPTIHGVSFSVLPQKTLALTASAQISLSLPLTANINTLQAGLKLDSDPYLVTSLTGLSLKNGTSDMKLGVNLQFIEMDQTPAKVALLADAAMKGKDVKTRVDLYGVSLGFSSEDQIRTFSRISFGLPMTTLFKQLSKPAASNSTSTSMAVPKLDVNPTKLDVTFEPGQIVSASAGAQMKLPFPVDVSVPFVALGVALDKTPALRPSVTGFTVSRSQENNANETLSVTAHLAIQDSDALTNKIGEITDAVIKGQKTDKSLSIDGFTIGASVEDAIQSFKLVSVDLGIDSLLASSQQKSELTGGAVASSISASFIDAVKLGSVDVSTHQGQSVLVNVNAAFNNHLQVSLTGLNHLAFGAGIDATPLVLTRLSGIQMKPGDNNMELKTALQFVPGRESQVKFATFMNDVMTKNATTLEQMVGVSGFQIGVSETDYIRAFSKAKLGLKASQLLSQGLHGPGLGGSGSSDLLKSLVINENNVDFSTPGAITIDIGVGLKNFSLPVSASVGYTGVSTDLNDAGLADLSVHNLKVSHTDGTLDVSCRVEIDIKGDDAIKKRVALLAKTILTKGLGEADVTARVYNFGLGASQSDLIETFSLIDVKGNPLKLIPKPDSIDKRGEKADMLKVDLITAELIDSRRIGAEVKSRVLGLPPIKLNLPYFSVAGHLDDGDFLEIEGKDINLDNGNLTMYGIMYTHKNLEAAQKLAYIVGNVLFHRPQTVPNNVSISNIRFGASKERSFKILDMIQLGAPMAPAIDGVTKVLDNPASYIELTEMKSTLVPTGISASFIGKPFPGGIPLATKPGFSATAKIGYGPNGIQEIVNIFFGDILAQPGQPFTGKADIHVRVPEILDALRENVPNLFTWKNYDQNITVGWPVMMAGDPHSPVIQFDPFDQIVIEAPPLYLYTPLTFEPHLVNPFKDGLGLDIDVYIPNPGPLFADFGFLTTTVYHNNDTIAQITTAEAVVIKNRANGGDKFGVNKIRLQNRIKLSKNPLKAWGELTDMMRNFKNYRVDIVASTPEYGRLDWLTTCFQHVPEFMTGKIAPLMIALLSHVKIKLGNKILSPPAKFREEAEKLLGGLPSEHIIIKGTESDVGRHRYMPVDNAVDLWSILEGEEITLADDEISAPEGDLKPAQEAVVDSALEVTGMVTGSVPSNFSQSANETTLVR